MTLKQALEVQTRELGETTSTVTRELESELKNIQKLKSQNVTVQIGDTELQTIEDIARFFRGTTLVLYCELNDQGSEWPVIR